MTMIKMTNESTLTNVSVPYTPPPKETAIRLAQLIWRRSAIKQLPIGPQLISAMENWLVPVRVYDYCQPRPEIREMFEPWQDWEGFDANTAVAPCPTGVRYVVVYNGAARQERAWWSLAHEFGHIVLQHALSNGWHDDPAREREANIFAAELLLPMGAVQEVHRWPAQKIAEYFGTSLEATKIRLKELAHGWLRLYTTSQIKEGKTRFVDTLERSHRSLVATKGAIILVHANREDLVAVQWARDIKGLRLKKCAHCGFENSSLYKDQETRCGRCGTLLINACENVECDLLALPLPEEYRCCGRCGQSTTWAQIDKNSDINSMGHALSTEADEDNLPDDLPF